ncbi:4085_t:CDS:1, partial [Gigaspora margarita]
KETIEKIRNQIVREEYQGIVTKALEVNSTPKEIITERIIEKEIIVQKEPTNQQIINKEKVSSTKRLALTNTAEAADYFVYQELKTQFKQGILPSFRYPLLILKAKKYNEPTEFLDRIFEKAPELNKEYFIKRKIIQ